MWFAGAAAAATVLSIAFATTLRRGAASNDRVPIRSLAVLPLANLTGDASQDYFSDGMTDALITNLASWPALRVISRQSVMRYRGSTKPLPEIARELGVEGVVEGSVVRSGGRVRITAQLIHAPTDRHLWAHSYERRLEDVLALQADVARAIAEEVRITVGTEGGQRPPRDRAVNPDAYDAYLLGRHHWSQRSAESLQKAIAYFQVAIAKDPDFAPAHAGLALAYGPALVYGDVPPSPAKAEMKSAALRALELDPDHLRSQLPFALFLLQHGRADLGWKQLERARALQPHDASVLASLAFVAATNGKPDEAHRLLRHLKDESARRYVSPVIPAFVHAALGEDDSAFALLEKAYGARDPLLIPVPILETQWGLRVPAERAAALRADPRFADLARRMGLPQPMPVTASRRPAPRPG
ncbi:MAG TPA: hypothetical protein VEQ84_12335 [Vicinamibacteria bacterium]|nr:hypothetical protein [Vicinamibacteria bacterium]